MGEVDPNNPFKPLAYIWLFFWIVISLVSIYSSFNAVLNWDIYYYSSHAYAGNIPLWLVVTHISLDIITIIWCLFLLILVNRNKINPGSTSAVIIPTWIYSLIVVLSGISSFGSKVVFVFLSLAMFSVVYDYAVFRNKR